MRVIGLRADGAMSILTAGKVVVLRHDRMSPPSEEAEVQRLGGWQSPVTVNTDLNTIQKLLDRARLAPLLTFAWDETKCARAGSGRFGEDNSEAGTSESSAAEKLSMGRDRIMQLERAPTQRASLKAKHPMEFHRGLRLADSGASSENCLSDADGTCERGTPEHDAILAGYAFGRSEKERSTRRDYKPREH